MWVFAGGGFAGGAEKHATMKDLHSGMQIRSGGATRADVEKMLKKTDANNDGQISQAEVEALAQQGRATGFSDQDSFDLFNAGLDAAALGEIKSREKGQQFSNEYIERTMKPFLVKAWGSAGAQAADLIAPQASRELTRDGAEGISSKTKLDALQRNAGQQVLGKDALMVDQGDGRVDADDVVLRPNAAGGYDREVLGQAKADQINDVAGLRRGMAMLDPGPYFPNQPGNPAWATRNDGPRAEWMTGGKPSGAWSMHEIPAGKPGAGYKEFKLDTKQMTASQALDDIAKNPKSYCMDCAMGKQVLQYQRMREVLGDAKFNDLASKHGMVIGHSDAALRSGLLAATSQQVPGTSQNTPLTDYQAGWGGYANVTSVGNPDVKKQLDAMGWSGEHFTVGLDDKGNKVVTAHPFGTVPLEKFDGLLRDRLVADSGGRIKREDIVIDYSRPVEFDPIHAREKL